MADLELATVESLEDPEKIDKYERELVNILPTTRHNLNNKYALSVGGAELLGNRDMEIDTGIVRNLTMILLVQAELFLSSKAMLPAKAKTVIFQELNNIIKNTGSLANRESDIIFREKLDNPEKIIDYEDPNTPNLDTKARLDYLQDKMHVLQVMRGLGLEPDIVDQIANLRPEDVEFFRLAEIMDKINLPLAEKIKNVYTTDFIKKGFGEDFANDCYSDIKNIPEMLRETEPYIYEDLEVFVGGFRRMAEVKLQRVAKNYPPDKKPYIYVHQEEGETFPVRIKPGAMAAVLDNLLSNSEKYSPDYRGYQIGIDIDLRRVGDKVILSWKDHGLGLATEDIPKIFAGEEVEDEAKIGLVSTRLGLPDCKRIIENQGGQISAESEGRGKGTTIKIELPIEKETNVFEESSKFALV